MPNRVRQAAAKGFEFFSGPEMEDRQLLQPEQVTGANKVFLRRPDGTTTQLTPQIVGGKLTGNYRIDDAYVSRQVGPASYVEEAVLATELSDLTPRQTSETSLIVVYSAKAQSNTRMSTLT